MIVPVTPSLTVVAIVSAYNEADVVVPVVKDLIAQGVQVYLIDDGSDDGTGDLIDPLVGHGVLAVERTPVTGDHPFDWERILRRKEKLAQELAADWFIHHDADEFRESPWPQATLRDAIGQVDAVGFNAIDFAVVEFQPIDNAFRPGDDPRAVLRHHSPPAEYDRLQVRCWKKTAERVDLVSSGGHEARFGNRRVFPLQFVLRHYPIRSQAHGMKKVFADRRSRFRPVERARGWHVQYDGLGEHPTFVRDPASLTAYDPAAIRQMLDARNSIQRQADRTIAELESARDGCRSNLLNAENRADALTRDLETANDTLSRVTAELSASAVALAKSEATTSALANRLDERDLELEAAGQRLQAQRDEADHLRRAVSELSREIDDLRQSLSWRWMAPARAALRLLRGR